MLTEPVDGTEAEHADRVQALTKLLREEYSQTGRPQQEGFETPPRRRPGEQGEWRSLEGMQSTPHTPSSARESQRLEDLEKVVSGLRENLRKEEARQGAPKDEGLSALVAVMKEGHAIQLEAI